MKILYISSLILKKGSSASIRNTGLIKGLNDNKVIVDILTIKYPEQLEDDYLKNILIKNKIYFNNLKILDGYLKLKNKGTLQKNGFLKNILAFLKKIIKNIYFFPDIDKEWIKEVSKLKINFNEYDLIITSSDTKTSHYIGRNIKKKYSNIPWFQIWGDPWASDIGIKGIKKIRARYSEKKILKEANKIFYVSPFTLEEMRKQYEYLKEKMEYLPRGFLEEIKSEKIEREKIIITYTGVLNINRNILPFFNIIKNYNNINKKKIEINIYGDIDKKILEKIYDYSFINYRGVVSFERIKEIYKQSDFLLFLDNGEKTTQIPGKIYDYLGTDRKIICLFRTKNDIFYYFKEKLKLLVYQENEINLNEIIESKERRINKDFSNNNIAKRLIRNYLN